MPVPGEPGAPDLDERLLAALWRDLGGPPGSLAAARLEGAPSVLPSRFEVSALATASIGVATLAIADLWAKRTGAPLRGVSVTRRHAAAAFRCERLMKAHGWTLPPVWDPIAGDYQTADGWVRLHTNYAWHRDATLRALGVPAEREAVARAARSWTSVALEEAVVDRGGAAAALRTEQEWSRHPQGQAVAGEPIFAFSDKVDPNAGGDVSRPGRAGGDVSRTGTAGDRSPPGRAGRGLPLSGLRVLDLTRVIAGPVCTRLLACFGADVLRLDPPGFAEVPALLPETTRGKRCAFLDLHSEEGRRAFDGLLQRADLMVNGYRGGALERLGYTADRLRALNPSLVTARLDAYGWTGPWSDRRGFDSLVQLSSGLAHPGDAGKPVPLPAQALDHATGYLLAAAACRALAAGHAEARLSLARTAKVLADLGRGGDPTAPDTDNLREFVERIDTAWGPMDTVRCAGRIEGVSDAPLIDPGALGRHEAAFANEMLSALP